MPGTPEEEEFLGIPGLLELDNHVDGTGDGRIQDLFQLQRRFDGGVHAALVLADRPAGYPEGHGQLDQRNILGLSQRSQRFPVDLHVQAAGRRVHQRRHFLDEKVVERLDVDAGYAVPEVHCPGFQGVIVGVFAYDHRRAVEEHGQPSHFLGSVFAQAFDVRQDFEKEQGFTPSSRHVKTSRPDISLLREDEFCLPQQSNDSVQQRFPCHNPKELYP